MVYKENAGQSAALAERIHVGSMQRGKKNAEFRKQKIGCNWKRKLRTLFCPCCSKRGKQAEHQGEQRLALHGGVGVVVVPGGVDAVLVGDRVAADDRDGSAAALCASAVHQIVTLNVAQSARPAAVDG